MSTTASPTQSSPQDPLKKGVLDQLLLPYLMVIVAQFPMLLLYARDLWGRPHYQFAPFAVVATIAIAYVRWPKEKRLKFHRNLFSTILFSAGLVFCLAGYAFMTPWFSACGVMLLVSSLLARTIDPETDKSLWPVSLPLFVTLVIPNNGDFQLINGLQRISSGFTSKLLDVFHLNHHLSGTIINLPNGEQLNIENACSGVQSFFTLLFIAIVFVVWERRPWFRSLLLVIAAVGIALLMNTIRIIMIPIADQIFNIDLLTGLKHELLGYGTLTIGILLLLSTDQVMILIFGPPLPLNERSGVIKRLTKLIRKNVLPDDPDNPQKRRRNRRPVSASGQIAIWSIACLMALVGAIQFFDVIKSYSSPELEVQFFTSDVSVPFVESDLPESFIPNPDTASPTEWKIFHFDTQDRKIGSDLGMRSDMWTYVSESKRIRSLVALDQTFPGWHELTVCYQNTGWQLVKREEPKVRTIIVDGQEVDWPFIEAYYEKTTGEHAFLIFSLFDAFGNPIEAPISWGGINSYITRAKNRLSHRIRGSLFQSEAYQTQTFVVRYGKIHPNVQNEIREQYLFLREEIRTEFLKKRLRESVATDQKSSASSTQYNCPYAHRRTPWSPNRPATTLTTQN